MGGPLGPNISFFASPVRTRKDFLPLFFCNCLNISYATFGKKNDIASAIFTLISISIIAQYKSLFLNRFFFFFKFYFKNVNVFIFS